MRDSRARAVERFVCKRIDSPIGGLVLVGNDDGLAAILWARDDLRVRLNIVAEDERCPVLVETARQLDSSLEVATHSM